MTSEIDVERMKQIPTSPLSRPLPYLTPRLERLSASTLYRMVVEMDETLDHLEATRQMEDLRDDLVSWRNVLASHYMTHHYDPTPLEPGEPPAMSALPEWREWQSDTQLTAQESSR